MPATEIQVTIGDVTFNTSFEPGATMYLLTSTEEILDALRTRRTDTPKQADHGSEDSLSSFEPRVLLFRGEIHATSQSQRVGMQQALDEAVSLSRSQDFSGDDGYKLVEVVDEDGIAKQLYAKIDQMPRYSLIEDGMPESRRFEFVMFASDPAVYAQALEEETTPESYDSTTFTMQDGAYPTFQDGALPTFQDTLESTITANNTGNYASPPQIVVTGPSTNPIIRNESTSKEFAFTRNGGVSLLAGDTLTIDVAAFTAIKTSGGVETNVRSKLSLSSKWFDIVPGENVISLMDSTTDDLTSQLDVNFRPSWI